MKSARMPSLSSLLAALLLLLAAVLPVHAAEEYAPLPEQGETCAIGSDYSFTWQFNKKPQLGLVILKIKLLDKDGRLDTSLKITGDSGMPSMSHHDTGEKDFKLNKKGDYLLPVDVVMPGEWAVKVVFYKEREVIYRGIIKFDV
jgi:hypothetical protein